VTRKDHAAVFAHGHRRPRLYRASSVAR